MPSELITSAQNPKVKRLLALQKDSSLRRESGLFVVEGQRELEHCMAAGFEPDTVFVCPDLYGPGDTVPRNFAPLIPPTSLRSWAPPVHAATGGHGSGAQVSGYRIIEVSREVYDKVAYRGGTEGVIAEMKSRERRLEDLDLPRNPLIMVLEAVEKPGNLGAVLRSADAAGADAVIICDPLTDLYNPNLIRASIGAVFTVPVAVCTSEEAIAWLKGHGIRILTAQL